MLWAMLKGDCPEPLADEVAESDFCRCGCLNSSDGPDLLGCYAAESCFVPVGFSERSALSDEDPVPGSILRASPYVIALVTTSSLGTSG